MVVVCEYLDFRISESFRVFERFFFVFDVVCFKICRICLCDMWDKWWFVYVFIVMNDNEIVYGMIDWCVGGLSLCLFCFGGFGF